MYIAAEFVSKLSTFTVSCSVLKEVNGKGQALDSLAFLFCVSRPEVYSIEIEGGWHKVGNKSGNNQA